VRSIENRRQAIRSELGSESPTADRLSKPARINLFVYGTLMYEVVWKRLVADDFVQKRARLSGYRRLEIRGEDYPGLVRGVGTVEGTVWLDVEERTLHRIDEFEADCYRRVSGVVIDDAGQEIPADFFVIRESHTKLVEQVEWDPRKFEEAGLERFVRSYSRFKD
jgi:gamma-glutamylcyclotransferase (GGCT)/AIG2-like uncharacterized protein YtfP